MIFDVTRCELGEGALWHPDRLQLFWFDILGRKMFARGESAAQVWDMPELTTAAARLAGGRLLLATESALVTFDPATGARDHVVALDAGDTGTRSNDGRADRQGGFWIGTMGKRGGDDVGRGAIWRYHKGELRRLYAGITIPNSICFAPDGRTAYFSDTVTQIVRRVALDAEGWPAGDPETFLDLRAEGLYPDGAVVAADGTFWNAQWGAGRVACYAPDGSFLRAVDFAQSPQTSCPAFGGPDLTTLYCTTAMEGMDAEARARHADAGRTFMAHALTRGLPEPEVTL